MSLFRFFFFALFALSVAAGCHRDSKPLFPNATAEVPPGWSRIDESEGHFSVALPDGASRSRRDHEGTTSIIWTGRSKLGSVFSVVSFFGNKALEPSPKVALRQFLVGFAKGAKMQITSASEREKDGDPVILFELRNAANKQMLGILRVHDQRLYAQMMSLAFGEPEDTVRQYVASFTI